VKFQIISLPTPRKANGNLEGAASKEVLKESTCMMLQLEFPVSVALRLKNNLP